MTFLLDVNVLVALITPDNLAHDAAHRWFEREGCFDWATCALTENGALRVLGNPKVDSSPGTPSGVFPMLESLLEQPGRAFWVDDMGLVGSDLIDRSKLARSKDITDTHLLALAVSRSARLATFDRRLRSDTVKGGPEGLFQIPA